MKTVKYIHELQSDAGTGIQADLNGCPVRLLGRNRVNILALGDVGTTMLMGLRLLGSDVISDIGILDIRRENLERLEMEINQIGYPFGMEDLPPVYIVNEENLFSCDVMIFCASRGVPPVSNGTSGESAVSDVRMAQLDANREIIKYYADLARKADYKGLVAVVSDPVDNLAAAFLDAAGLEPWQVQGYGLGVMNKRAEYYAERVASGNTGTGKSLYGDSLAPEACDTDECNALPTASAENSASAKSPDSDSTDETLREATALYLKEGRAFGPHGQDLVIANSIENYDEEASRLLTNLTVSANMKVRELGFKPYIAPALSSAAISILLTLRGEWHYGSVYIGSPEKGAFLGIKNRLTEIGWEYEDIALPPQLYRRILKAYTNLIEIR